ncbi:MAG: SulP family inorganic anion transporter, partial [bacterium]
MFAFVESAKGGLLRKENVLANILPGIIVGVIALPLGMAFAIASGVAPENGLYTSIIAGFCVSVFGGSRVQIAGPTGAFVVILCSITQKYGFAGLQLATLMAGVFLLFMGLFRLGSIIKYIPEPVIVGFTSGVALTIWIGQWKDFFGLNVQFHGASLQQKLSDLFSAFPTMDTTTTIMGVTSLAIILFCNKFLKSVPGFLLALIVASLAQGFFRFDTVATIGTAFGGIPQTLPTLHFPEGSWELVSELISPAFTIALLGAIESLLSAAVADSMIGTHHNSNQELIGQGIANIIAPLFGGFAATGAIARTAANIKSGGNSPVAGLVHCATVILFILVLSPFAVHIPIVVLSAILFVVAYNMSDYRRFIRILSTAPKSDVFVLIVTFLLTIFVDLVVAVNIGVVFATLFFMRRMSKTVQIEHNSAEALIREQIRVDVPQDVSIYSIEGPFFFGSIEAFQS